MFGLCQFKDWFGKPGLGVHRLRGFGLALVDVLLTVMVSFWLSRRNGWNLTQTIIATVVVGELAHYVFCVNTTVLTGLGIHF